MPWVYISRMVFLSQNNFIKYTISGSKVHLNKNDNQPTTNSQEQTSYVHVGLSSVSRIVFLNLLSFVYLHFEVKV